MNDILFSKFKKIAYRIETLSNYSIEGEKKSFQDFMNGKDIKHSDEAWLKLVSDLTKSGKEIKRIRIIDSPLTDYEKYEFCCYKYNVLSGENIYILDRKEYKNIKSIVIDEDFWVFDNSLVVKLIYDKDGKYICAKELNELESKEYIKLLDVILDKKLIDYKNYFNC